VNSTAKLYLVTRADLRHGSQAVQLVHGMATFAKDYPCTFASWERESNFVVCLTVPDEDALYKLFWDAERISNKSENGLAVSSFREPDWNDALTCVVLEPDVTQLQELCAGLPLACR